MSQAAYCRQHQLTYATFSARLCEFRAQAKLSPPVLLPIQVQSPPLSKAGLILHHGKYRLGVARQCLCIVAGGVITLSGLVAAPVDMRRGIDGLSSIVQHALEHSPCVRLVFVFHNLTARVVA